MSLVEIYRLLRCVVQPQWHQIPPTSSEEWKAFAASATATPSAATAVPRPAAAAAETAATASLRSLTSSTAAAETPEAADALVEAGMYALPSKRRLLLLIQAAAMLETPWAVSQVRLRGIEEAARSRPLYLEELISYARRLGGTTAAPPETANVADPAAHETVYPSFHFLPFPSLEELQTSRLSFLQSRNYGKSCFPPEIRPRLVYESRSSSGSRDIRGENSQQLRRSAAGFQTHFVCQTSGATVTYKVVDGIVSAAAAADTWTQTEAAEEQTYDTQRPPLIPPPFPKTILARATHPSLSPSGIRALCLKLRVAPTSSSRVRAAATADATSVIRAQEAAVRAERDGIYTLSEELQRSTRSEQTSASYEGRETLPAELLLRRQQQQQQTAASAAEGAETSAAQQQRLHSEVARRADSETMSFLRRDAGARRDSVQQQQTPGGTPAAAATAFRGLLLGTARRQRRRAEGEQEEEEASEDSDDSSSSSSDGSSEEEEESAEKRTEKT